MNGHLERIDVDRRIECCRGALVITQLLQGVGERELRLIIRFIRCRELLQVVSSLLCLTALEMDLRQQPGRAIITTILREEHLRARERRDSSVVLAPVEQLASPDEFIHELVQPSQRRGETFVHVRVELLVERREIDLEHALENVIRRSASLVRLQHLINGVLTVVARD